MKDRDPGSSPASATAPRRQPTRPGRPRWLPWTVVVATVAGAMSALVLGGRPVGTLALPPAAIVAPRPLTAAQGGTGDLRVGSVTVVSPVRPVEVYDAETETGPPESPDIDAPAPSDTTRTGSPGSSGTSGSSAPAGSAGSGAGTGGGGTAGSTPGATTTTIPPGGSSDGSDDTTNDGTDDPGATATTTAGTGPVDNARLGPVVAGS